MPFSFKLNNNREEIAEAIIGLLLVFTTPRGVLVFFFFERENFVDHALSSVYDFSTLKSVF